MEEHQMPCWYYEKEELLRTPSVADGIEPKVEDLYRSEGARFIFDLSTKLRLRYDTCATAIVFFHRFYMLHSFNAFPRHVTAACCLMLAGKVEETPKKCRDIIRTARELLPDQLFQAFGNDPREEIMMYERVLLKTIKFDLQVSHPYTFLTQYAKRIKGDSEKVKHLVQMAWSFINDSLATTLCLQWEPEIVACAVLYLATRMKKCPLEDWEGRSAGQRWWECFVEGMSTDVMEDICHKILDLYPSSSGILGDDLGSSRKSSAVVDNTIAAPPSTSKRSRPSSSSTYSTPSTSSSSQLRKPFPETRGDISLSKLGRTSVATSWSQKNRLPPPPLSFAGSPEHTPSHPSYGHSGAVLPPPPPPPPSSSSSSSKILPKDNTHQQTRPVAAVNQFASVLPPVAHSLLVPPPSWYPGPPAPSRLQVSRSTPSGLMALGGGLVVPNNFEGGVFMPQQQVSPFPPHPIL